MTPMKRRSWRVVATDVLGIGISIYVLLSLSRMFHRYVSGRNGALIPAAHEPASTLSLRWDSEPVWFDLLKEVNAQAGRLATLTALLWGVFTWSLQLDPIKPYLRFDVIRAVIYAQPDETALLQAGSQGVGVGNANTIQTLSAKLLDPAVLEQYPLAVSISMSVAATVVYLVIAFVVTSAALLEAVPIGESSAHCLKLVHDKAGRCQLAVSAIIFAFGTYASCWVMVVNPIEVTMAVQAGIVNTLLAPVVYGYLALSWRKENIRKQEAARKQESPAVPKEVTAAATQQSVNAPMLALHLASRVLGRFLFSPLTKRAVLTIGVSTAMTSAGWLAVTLTRSAGPDIQAFAFFATVALSMLLITVLWLRGGPPRLRKYILWLPFFPVVGPVVYGLALASARWTPASPAETEHFWLVPDTQLGARRRIVRFIVLGGLLAVGIESTALASALMSAAIWRWPVSITHLILVGARMWITGAVWLGSKPEVKWWWLLPLVGATVYTLALFNAALEVALAITMGYALCFAVLVGGVRGDAIRESERGVSATAQATL